MNVQNWSDIDTLFAITLRGANNVMSRKHDIVGGAFKYIMRAKRTAKESDWMEREKRALQTAIPVDSVLSKGSSGKEISEGVSSGQKLASFSSLILMSESEQLKRSCSLTT